MGTHTTIWDSEKMWQADGNQVSRGDYLLHDIQPVVNSGVTETSVLALN